MPRLVSPPTWALVALASLVIVATSAWSIAACGPWDPWETHYGEVARQILVRSDPLDLWWHPGTGPDGNAENTFWSKPALPFWLMALSMKLLGVGTQGPADEMVQPLWPELAIRLPSMIAGLTCAALLGWACARVLAAGRPQDPAQPARAGLLVALALCTMPQWAIVTRQALTDMFFVGPVTAAMAAWALAWLRPDRELGRRALGGLLPRGLRARLEGTGPPGHEGSRARRALAALLRAEVPWDRAYLGFLLVFAAFAVAPIVALDLHVSSDVTVARVARFVKRPGVPRYETLVKIHWVMMGYGALALGVFLRTLRWRTRSQAWMGVLYVAAGVSLVGKGMIGPGLVGLLVLLHLVVTGTLSLASLRRCGLVAGLALFVLAALPWHHAMYIYRGESWFNELIIVNNLARFGTGEQDQAVGGFAYYLRTLGLAALPWSAALPAALWAAARHLRRTGSEAPEAATRDLSSLARDPEGGLRRLALVWFCAALALITASVTKYYHYLLPALPPFAVLVGLWLVEPAPRDRRLAWTAGALGLVLCALVLRDALAEPAWIAHLTTYLYDHMWRQGAPATTGLLYCAPIFAVGLGLWASLQRRAALAAMLLSALLTTWYTLNDYLPAASENWSQRTAIRHYYAARGPEDPLASWWFYYRGETFFTRAEVWVQKEADREALVELVDELRGGGRTLWILTTGGHVSRAKNSLPVDVRRGAEVAYENAHYGLLRAPIP